MHVNRPAVPSFDDVVFRKTNQHLGRRISVTPANSTTRHLSYGRIILNQSQPSVRFRNDGQETDTEYPEFVVPVRDGDAVLMPRGYHSSVAVPGHAIRFLWAMAAHREQADRQFGVVNVQPEFSQSGSGLESSRK